MSTLLSESVAGRLNMNCHCVAVERPLLEASLAEHLNDAVLARSLATTHRHLFSSSPVFVGAGHVRAMQSVVDAIENLAALPAFQDEVAARLRAGGLELPARRTPALLGIDFHITDDGPRLIEVNTNPGGVLLALHLQRAQKACCEAVEEMERPLASPEQIEQTFIEMARATLGSVPSARRPRIAIVDERPAEQFLYPEFRLYRELFRRHGLEAQIADVADLRYDGLGLRHGDDPVDGVYNRSTDFLFQEPTTQGLRAAWSAGAVGVSPDPWTWSTYADKRNLVLLSDGDALREFGLGADELAVLATHVPRTERMDEGSAGDLWSRRKSLFFKPVQGHGSRGAYDGRKISRRKFDSLIEGSGAQPFVAQQLVPPSERTLLFDESERRLKLDVRCVSWEGRILMLVGRLYQGQATNMRTEGGGLATAFVA